MAVITLTGDGSYERQLYLKQLINNFISSYGDYAVEKIIGAEAGIDQLRAALTSGGLFSDHKMVVLDQPSLVKGFSELYQELLGSIDESMSVVINEAKLDKRLSLYKYLKSHSQFKEFNSPDYPSLSKWVEHYARQHKGDIGRASASYLVERLGANQQSLKNELDKLLLYNRQINKESIDLLTEPAPQSTIFQLLEAAFNGRRHQALTIYDQQRALKVEPANILAMIVWQLYIIAVVKLAKDKSLNQVAAEAGLKPYVLDKASYICQKLSAQDIRRLVSDLLNLDLRSKTKSIDLDGALKNYLLFLSS